MNEYPKCHQRSIRMSDPVKDWVECQQGNGFNDKFDKAVYRLMWEEAEIDRRIAEKKKLLGDLNKLISAANDGLSILENMRWNLDRAKNGIARMADVIDETIKAPTPPKASKPKGK